MRSGISGGTTRPYRKYRPLPALILIAILGGASALIWFKVLNDSANIDEAIRCEPPASAPPGMIYTSLSHDALDHVDPIPPEEVRVRVLNASGKRRQAALVTESLRNIGFTRVGKPANDKAYENREKPACRGQIRFGENGEAAARTLSLIDPCLELVKDERKGASVDLAIGEDFVDVRPRREALTALEALSQWADKYRGRSSELSANDDKPQLSKELLAAARSGQC
ncbi:envelope integrity protein Cei [Thermocrispum sp.]|uniref:Envelope integrity protein Cei n=1 Tax=Thermocrispum agreste TaxID=37925 RepID=A0ABD6FGP0_9PSEU|nr:envelope integrity protein Cei [Thermocrispum sp.]